MRRFLISNSKGEKSMTATLLWFGSIAVLIKYILGGLTIGGIVFPLISGFDAAAIIGALGGIYAARRSPQLNPKSDVSEEDK